MSRSVPMPRDPRARTRWRGAVAALAVIATAVPIVLFTGGQPAAAAGTVAPSKTTGVAYAGETITIDGAGFDSSRGIYVMFCQQVGTPGTAAGRPAGANCSGAQAWITTGGPPGTTAWTGAGTFSVSLAVSGAFKAVDCNAAGTVCGIATRNDHTQGGQYDQDTFTPIAFAPSATTTTTTPATTTTSVPATTTTTTTTSSSTTTTAPPSGPASFSVSPTSGLDAAGDSVTVTGSGLGDRGVYVRFCQATAGRPTADQCDGQGLWLTPNPPDPGVPATSNGSFRTTLSVAGRFAGGSSVIDCTTAGSCGVHIRRDHNGGASDTSLDGFWPLSFDATTAPPEVPEPEASANDVSIALSKDSGLADGETITVTGQGFKADQGVYVQFCARPTGQVGTAAGRADRCYPEQDGTHTVWVTPVASDGKISTPLTVAQGFTTADGEAIDCTVTACGVYVRRDHNGGASDYSQDAYAAVAFGEGTLPEPPAGGAALAADRTSGLDPDGDTITVDGTGFRPGVDYVVTVCEADDKLACDYSGSTTVTSEQQRAKDPGDFTVDLAVRSVFDGTDCREVNCAVSTFAVSLSTAADEVSLPIGFAAASDGQPSDGSGSGSGDGSGGASGGGTTTASALPRTGSSTTPLLVTGLVALITGGALVLGTRRRAAQA